MNDVREFETVRVVFSKTGRAKYISHLDLNRTMIRAFRRAGLPIWYTEGFNRHPYVTFAAPLSLGYEGERETMDLRLKEDMDMGELVRRLDAVMPEGLHVYDAAKAVMKPGRWSPPGMRSRRRATRRISAISWPSRRSWWISGPRKRP